jgi:hypothetical protein
VAAEQHDHAGGIHLGGTARSDGIQMRSSLWVTWVRVVFEHETMAQAARQQALQHGADHGQALRQGDAGKTTQHGTDLAQALSRELDAALVGICAAAFALEALSRELGELGAIPQTTLDRWREARKQGQGPAAEDVALEVLSKTFDMRGFVPRLQGELPRLFDMRDGAVHYEGSFESTRPHPVGSDVSVAQDTYSADNCTLAADLLMDILERCRNNPKPPGKQWSHDRRRTLDELIGRRGQAG